MSDFNIDLSKPLLLTNVQVFSTHDPYAEALLIEDSVITWVGSIDSATKLFGASVNQIKLNSNLVTPSFWEIKSKDFNELEDLKNGITRRIEVSNIKVIQASASEIDYLTIASKGEQYLLSGSEFNLSPWEVIRQAAYLSAVTHRISARTAFWAMTRAPRRAKGFNHPGALNPGSEADIVVWQQWPLTVKANQEAIQTWSTDPRSRTPMLPDLAAPQTKTPSAVLVISSGEVKYYHE